MAEQGLRMGTRAGRWVLLTTVLGSSLAMLDGTVVNVALAHIGEDLDARPVRFDPRAAGR